MAGGAKLRRRTGLLLKISWWRRRTRVVDCGAMITSSARWLLRLLELFGISGQPMADPKGIESVGKPFFLKAISRLLFGR